MKKSNWTKEEDKLMVKELQKEGAYLNLSKCFAAIAVKLDRSPCGVATHYYTKLRKEKPIFVTMGKNSAIHNTKIGKQEVKIKPERALWSKILKLFKK